MLLPEVFFCLGELGRTKNGLALPRWLPGGEAFYAFFLANESVEGLLRMPGGGLVRAGSTLDTGTRLQTAVNAACRAFEIGGPHSQTNMHSLVRFQVSTGAQIELSELWVLVVYSECACQIERAAQADSFRRTGRNPPGNPTKVGCPRGKHWREQCNGRAGEILWASIATGPRQRL